MAVGDVLKEVLKEVARDDLVNAPNTPEHLKALLLQYQKYGLPKTKQELQDEREKAHAERYRGKVKLPIQDPKYPPDNQ